MKHSTRPTKLTLSLLALASIAWPVHAAEKQLSLQDAIKHALKVNLGMQIERLGPQITYQELLRQQSTFGLIAGFDAQLNQSISPTSNSFAAGTNVIEQMRQEYNLFVEQSFDSGGTLRLGFNNGILGTNSTRVDVNPALTPQVEINLRHPLLRNLGNGQRQLQLQVQQWQGAQWSLKQTAIDTTARVQDTYWDLVLFRERLRVLEQSMQILQELRLMNQEKEKAGFMSRIDNLQTEARIASLQANLLDARRNVENTADQLKALLNPTGQDLDWNTEIVPSDRPQFQAISTDLELSYSKALQARPDYHTQLLAIESNQIQLEIRQQNLLPQLDFTGSSGLESLDSQYFGALGKLFLFQTYFWSLGVSYQMPVVGNPQQASFDQAKLQQEQQTLRLEQLRQQIRRELRQAIRNLQMSAQQIEATRIAKRLAEEQLKAQTEKLNLGLTTNFQVLQFQTDFVQASLDEVNALVQYTQAINQWQQLEGTLLESLQIPWEALPNQSIGQAQP